MKVIHPRLPWLSGSYHPRFDALMAAALADGSSYTCPKCGGVVPTDRKANHDKHWCEAGGTTVNTI
jgi:hypothetical protein